MNDMRLQKFLAESGLTSRRKAEELIKQGRVKVNGTITAEMGVKVSSGDLVELDGEKVTPVNRKIYIALNKPSGYVTTVKDQFSRPSVIDLLQGLEERVYPVGRLDYNTSGLLLLTNDGDFAFALTHPGHEIKKVYEAEIMGTPSEQELSCFKMGLIIEDYTTAPAGIKIIRRSAKTSIAEITIHEGRNRQVRKMCEAIGHPVLRLKRTAIGKITLGDLPEGKWRHLSEEEVKAAVQ